MPIAKKAAIAFGLVYIPVGLYTAARDNNIRFHQLAKENMARVRYKKTCPGCKAELTEKDIVKGFEYSKDKYVVITDEDFEKIKTTKDRNIEIILFTDPDAISPVYFNRSYQVVSEKGGEKAFELLRLAMQRENKIAIGKTVMTNAETLLALIPTTEGMLMETLYYYDEIQSLPKEPQHPKVTDAEMDMASQLIESLTKPFKPEEYHDEYQLKLKDLIEKKIAGEEIVTPPEATGETIVDLMDALKASLQQTKPKVETIRKKKKAA